MESNLLKYPVQLRLESGEVFSGFSPFEINKSYYGEAVFNTGMVGYTETITDPSYLGQIVTFTYPMIGNYGVDDKSTWESDKIQASGVIVSSLCDSPQREFSQKSLAKWCEESGVPLIYGIDTRALTKVIRDKGVVSAVIESAVIESKDNKSNNNFIDINSQDLVKQVCVNEPKIIKSGKYKVIVVDCGVKQNILRNLCKFDFEIKLVPYDYNYLQDDFDGLFLSNGPGDPAKCKETIRILKEAIDSQIKQPIFGICLGSQIMGLAIGSKTFKMSFGHRAQNHPCLDINTNKCFLTSQNHGFAIDPDTIPKDWDISFKNLNDGSVAGIKNNKLPYASVQFHPEANPGPIDTAYLFQQFYEDVENNAKSKSDTKKNGAK